MIGLSARKPLDDTKLTQILDTQKKTKTIHVETIGNISDAVKHDIKIILKSKLIKKIHSELCLIQPYDFRQKTTHYNSKVNC